MQGHPLGTTSRLAPHHRLPTQCPAEPSHSHQTAATASRLGGIQTPVPGMSFTFWVHFFMYVHIHIYIYVEDDSSTLSRGWVCGCDGENQKNKAEVYFFLMEKQSRGGGPGVLCPPDPKSRLLLSSAMCFPPHGSRWLLELLPFSLWMEAEVSTAPPLTLLPQSLGMGPLLAVGEAGSCTATLENIGVLLLRRQVCSHWTGWPPMGPTSGL